MKKVTVLLSSYNGEKYIEEQLNSLYKQENVDVSIVVRDDGSSDSTIDILRKEEKKHGISVIEGENLGFCDSFWELILKAPDSEYYALCDQDDFWLSDKLSNAIDMLEKEDNNTPLLYTSNVIPVDEELKELNIKSFNAKEVVSYAFSLRCPVLPGCTFVFNRALINFLRRYNGFFYLHDWLIYIIASGLGKVLFDPNPRILYRQHSNNALGVDSPFEKALHKINRFLKPKTKRDKSKVAEGIYRSYKNELTTEKRKLTESFAFYYKSKDNFFTLMKYREYRTPVFIFQLLLRKV